jgi:hypothetical protein
LIFFLLQYRIPYKLINKLYGKKTKSGRQNEEIPFSQNKKEIGSKKRYAESKEKEIAFEKIKTTLHTSRDGFCLI